MTRDNLEEWAKGASYKFLSENCNAARDVPKGVNYPDWFFEHCPISNVDCPLQKISKCEEITSEDWQKALGELPEETVKHEEGFINEMTRDDLAEWAQDLSCIDLVKVCKGEIGSGCPSLGNECRVKREFKKCADITTKDWEMTLGEVSDDEDETTIDEDFFKNATPPLKEHPYMVLRCILDEAYEQAAEGKGKERHAGDKPFLRQPIMEIGRMVGEGYNLGQAMKKLQEAETLLHLEGKGVEAAVRELLGAIVYTASAVILLREKYGEKK
jgi:hypothetical protein